MIKAGVTLSLGENSEIAYTYFNGFGTVSKIGDFSNDFSNDFAVVRTE